MKILYPDAKLSNADWPKKTPDFTIVDKNGKIVGVGGKPPAK